MDHPARHVRRFVHLHVHSEYSLADSTIRIEDLVARCAAHGQPSVAVTDRNNLFSLVKFYRQAEATGISRSRARTYPSPMATKPRGR